MVVRWQNRSEGSLPVKPRHTNSSTEARRRRRRRVGNYTRTKQARHREAATPPQFKHGQRPPGRQPRRPDKRPMTPR